MGRRWLRRGLYSIGALVLALVLLTIIIVIDGWRAFGAAPAGARLERVRASKNFTDGAFHNTEPMWVDNLGSVTDLPNAIGYGSPELGQIPVTKVDPAMFDTPPASGLRITWLGHSTMLIEIDGHTLLTDPVWGRRASPLTWVGPERWYDPPLALADLPAIDAVLLSHDHYDHLDYPTIHAMRDVNTTFIAPIGVSAHLEYWGVPAERIVEVDWWEKIKVGDIDVTATPARHASGRHVFDQNTTQWVGYALHTPQHRVFFSGDTGLFRGMKDIGEKLGPFDVTMLEVGAYGRAWPDWHLGPEQAVRAQEMLRGKVLMPIHWGLFNLAYHSWVAPAERVIAAAETANVDLVVPRPGDSFEPATPPPINRWWPADVPWRNAVDDPIVATKVD